MFTQKHEALALNFARALSFRNYPDAYELCSATLKSQCSLDELRQQFESMIPSDWGAIDPIEINDLGDLPFIYVVLGGELYSEAIIIGAFSEEDGALRIDSFEFGRP